jgi:NADPH-dependent glutamate synthase beta subunit-like oxidoreductase
LKKNSDPSTEFVIPISYGSTEVIETGKWGFQKPQTAFMIAPCQEACPAGNPIAQFLYSLSQGNPEEALLALLRENPFPGVCGRACFHPCEAACNRGQYDEAVSINGLERYVFDATLESVPDVQPLPNPDPRQVAIVGSGPAGLSCAYFLSLLGHQVTLFEAKKELGGILRWGIPEYRLPKSVVRKEIERVLRFGVKAKTSVTVGKDISLQELDRYDAIFLSPGAQERTPLGIEGKDLKQVWRGGDFLERINSGQRVSPGKEVIVVGGGNTAMDVARSALRLGAKVTIAYRRTRAEMPAIADEIREAEEEGARFEFLVQPAKIEEVKGRKISVTFQRMRLGDPDSSHRPRPVPVEGDLFTLKADHLIEAVGEGVDLSWIPHSMVRGDLIDAGPFLSTPGGKVFAGGDAIDQPRTIVTAIGAGKRAAIAMDLFLRGVSPQETFSKVNVGQKGALSMEAYLSGRRGGDWPEAKEVVPYDKINTLYFEQSRRSVMRKLDRERGIKDFSEVNLGFSPDEAGVSAMRCFSCGTCNYCYNCYFFCPEGIISLDPASRAKTVDLEHCKGCGTCAKACPRYVVEMKEAM